MVTRNQIEGFPPDVRRMIQRKLYDCGFQDYAGLAKQLTADGHAVSKSALHRYGRVLEAQIKQAELDKLMGHDGMSGAENTEGAGGVQLDLLDGLDCNDSRREEA
ncbi:MAG: DUF3486 family protein [Rhodocyclaceae bacterium]|nr:DUF3486 family protein [Rhodocyclaceae bacterium]